ncbi:MAG: hypothetical protein ACRENP_26540 [Longimicrobiales bacterium]
MSCGVRWHRDVGSDLTDVLTLNQHGLVAAQLCAVFHGQHINAYHGHPGGRLPSHRHSRNQ